MQTSNIFHYHLPKNPEQLEKIVPKFWGHEEWIINNHAYCGKKLVFKEAGYACSLHYHKIKDETFYLSKGSIIVELEEAGIRTQRHMIVGDVQRITPGVYHRIIALEPAEVIEFSTFHQEEDSYRIIEAGKLDLGNFKEVLQK